MRSTPSKAVLSALGGALLVMLVAGIVYDRIDYRQRMESHAAEITGGDPARGQVRFIAYGCGACHAIADVPNAKGGVGPGLDKIALQAIIAGRLPNNADNMRLWIQQPQRVSPGTAMPNLGVTDRDASDISAFLYARPN